MQAILTRYVGPTNRKGGHVKAVCEAKSQTSPWNYELDVPGNHRAAAERLAKGLGWLDGYRIESGWMPGDRGYAHVLVVDNKAKP